MKKSTIKIPKRKAVKASTQETKSDISSSSMLACCGLEDTLKEIAVIDASGDHNIFTYGAHLEWPEAKTAEKEHINDKNDTKNKINDDNDTKEPKDNPEEIFEHASTGFIYTADIKNSTEAAQSSAPSDSEWYTPRTPGAKLDFTPTPDDELYYEKCSDFWDFVYSNDELRKMMKPKKRHRHKKDIPVSDDVEATTSKETKENEDWVKYPAYSRVACMTAGQVQPAFPTKATIKMQSYKTSNTEEIKKMFEDMDAFDKKNPKSFAPPGKPPEKCTVVMQRAYLPAIQ